MKTVLAVVYRKSKIHELAFNTTIDSKTVAFLKVLEVFSEAFCTSVTSVGWYSNTNSGLFAAPSNQLISYTQPWAEDIPAIIGIC